MSRPGRATGRKRGVRSRILSACAAALVAAIVAGCSDAGDASDLGPRQATGTVIIGSADDPASRIEALIYAGALRGIGAPVETRLGIGTGDAAVAAVERGEITVAPALTGELWQRYRPGAAEPSSPADPDAKQQWDAQFVAVSAVLPEGLGLGDPTLALDQPMLYARSGAPSATLRGCEGLAGPVAVPAGTPTDLKARYGCDLGQVIAVADDDAAARAVNEGRAALAQLGTLSPAALPFTQVADPDTTVPSRAVVALLRRDGLTVPQTKRLSAVAGELNTVDLAKLVAQVKAGEKTPEEAATDWSVDHPLH